MYATYADDTVIFFSCNSNSEIEMKLPLDLVNISHWLEKANFFWISKKRNVYFMVPDNDCR